ncbi:MAG TPA: hypothetical protein VL989_03635 [Candidatus Sulfotelmatobacter sp.]|nr:hypothetical protein [Candidatus Sulfotelmatobacter sp.]
MRKNKLIVFFVPPKKDVNGGIISIFSICKVSREFTDIHNSDVVISTFPSYKSYKTNDLFKNDEVIYSFDEIVDKGPYESLQLHVPEYASKIIFDGIRPYFDYLKSIPNLSINILNQNILMMNDPLQIANWFMLTPSVTQTTAHDRYTTQKLADTYDLPTKHLSTFVDSSQYEKVPYDKKEKLIVLSPDESEKRDVIIKTLSQKLPDYKQVVIKNMPYEEYKKTIARAKFTLTFGEGFDGYYVEGFFSGGVTFAIYNDDFFPDKEFSKFENTFSSDKDMLDSVVGRMAKLDNRQLYEKLNKLNLERINKLYSYDAYKQNIKNFYLKHYDFIPERGAAEILIGGLINEREKLLEAKDSHIEEKKQKIVELQGSIDGKDKVINDLTSAIDGIEKSKSWKVTKPLRKASSLFEK